MSQEFIYSRVNTVRQDAARFRQQMAPVISEILKSIPAEVRQKCTAPRAVISVSDNVLLAPSELKHIQSELEHNMAALKSAPNVVRLQASALNTLMSLQSQLAISKPEVITTGLQTLASAKTYDGASTALKSVFAEIRRQHTCEFVSGLTSAITGSATTIGFSNVSIVESSSKMVRVVAKNPISQYLVCEIEIGETIDVHSELIGITDGSCDRTMCKFEEELAKHGITVSDKERNPTKGIPQMPFSKKLLKKKTGENRVLEDVAVVKDGIESTIKIRI